MNGTYHFYMKLFLEQIVLLKENRKRVPMIRTRALSTQLTKSSVDSVKLGLHMVVMVISTVANMFLTLFRAVLIYVNTLITTSQA